MAGLDRTGHRDRRAVLHDDPLSEPALVNAVGQLYHGPVVLITDALCYSACDMFAGGFADHEIGRILGVDANTGAGGANVLDHDQLRSEWTNGPLRALPAGAGMRGSWPPGS